MTITDDIAEAIGKVPARAWTPAYDSGRQPRDGASGTPPTRRDSRAARHRTAMKTAVNRRLNPPIHHRERCRLASAFRLDGKWGRVAAQKSAFDLEG